MTWRTLPFAPAPAVRLAAPALALVEVFFAGAAFAAALGAAFAAAALAGVLGVAAFAIVSALFRPFVVWSARGGRTASLERLGARNDLDQFLGNVRLALTVVGDCQPVDHLARIAGRIVHRRHLGAHLAGAVLEQRLEDLHRDVARNEIGKDLARLRLIFVHRATVAGCLIARGSRGRNDLLRGRNLGDDRLELRVEQGADVEAALVEELNDLLRNSIGVREGKLANLAKVHPINDQGGKVAPKYVVALLAHADDLDRLAFALEPADMLARKASDLRIE